MMAGKGGKPIRFTRHAVESMARRGTFRDEVAEAIPQLPRMPERRGAQPLERGSGGVPQPYLTELTLPLRKGDTGDGGKRRMRRSPEGQGTPPSPRREFSLPRPPPLVPPQGGALTCQRNRRAAPHPRSPPRPDITGTNTLSPTPQMGPSDKKSPSKKTKQFKSRPVGIPLLRPSPGVWGMPERPGACAPLPGCYHGAAPVRRGARNRVRR